MFDPRPLVGARCAAPDPTSENLALPLSPAAPLLTHALGASDFQRESQELRAPAWVTAKPKTRTPARISGASSHLRAPHPGFRRRRGEDARPPPPTGALPTLSSSRPGTREARRGNNSFEASASGHPPSCNAERRARAGQERVEDLMVGGMAEAQQNERSETCLLLLLLLLLLPLPLLRLCLARHTAFDGQMDGKLGRCWWQVCTYASVQDMCGATAGLLSATRRPSLDGTETRPDPTRPDLPLSSMVTTSWEGGGAELLNSRRRLAWHQITWLTRQLPPAERPAPSYARAAQLERQLDTRQQRCMESASFFPGCRAPASGPCSSPPGRTETSRAAGGAL
ncbi:hypothetical protein JHW43_002983 [Diplocarpon mali]|nr:hypothetical protein JHW43_002983 [Diplocarpon mali]